MSFRLFFIIGAGKYVPVRQNSYFPKIHSVSDKKSYRSFRIYGVYSTSMRREPPRYA